MKERGKEEERGGKRRRGGGEREYFNILRGRSQ